MRITAPWRTKKEFFILCGILLVANAGMLQLQPRAYSLSGIAGVPLSKELELFPRIIGRWAAGPRLSLPAEVEAAIAVDAYLLRNYVHDRGMGITLYVSYYEHEWFVGGSAHTPDSCYTCRGWSLLEVRSELLEVANLEDGPVPVDVVYLHKQGLERIVFDLFVTRRGIVSGKHPFGMVGWGLRKARLLARPGFVAQIQVLTDVDEARSEAAAAAREFLQLALPELVTYFEIDEAE